MSAAESSSIRERRVPQDANASTQEGPSETKIKRTETKINEILAEEDGGFSIVDALRGVVFVVLIAGVLGYFVAGENGVWNQYRPKWTRSDVVKGYFAKPIEYTDANLKQYAGQDPTKPLLVALNGTVYDVSAGRRHYGPGGSYSVFAGADASRAFVTGCFKEDRNPDLRGVEEMYLPLDDPEVDALYSEEEMKIQKVKELEHAKAQAHAALKHWVDFFANNPKYPVVGKVKRPVGWETKGKPPVLCKQARDGRPKRRNPPPGKTVKSKATTEAAV